MDTTNPQEDCLSQHRSFGSNYQGCSQSRKISIGVLVDSTVNSQSKSIKEAVLQTAENGTSRKGNNLKDREGHIPLLEKQVTVSPKDASPWVSTRPFTPKISSSVAVHDAEHTQRFPAKARPRSKLSKKVSAAHSVKYFAGKTSDLAFDDGRQNNSDKPTYGVEVGNLNNSMHVENPGFSTESGILRGKEQGKDKNRKTETGGSETLRIKLWEILADVSSPKNKCVGSQLVELHPNQERAEKHTPSGKRSPDSDTIESDSERVYRTSRRPLTRSFTRKKASTRKVHNNLETTKPNSHQKECQQMSIFSFGGDWPGRLHGTTTDGPFQRKKIVRESSGVEKHQGSKYENEEERQQSENKSITKIAFEKSIFQGNKLDIANSSRDKISDVIVEPKRETKKKDTFQSSPTLINEQPTDVEKPVDVEIPKVKDQQEDIVVSFLKRKRGSINDTTNPTFEINSPIVIEHSSPSCLLKSKQKKHQDQSPADNIINTEGIRSFKNLLSSKSAQCISNVQVQSSDDEGEQKDCFLMKSSFMMEEDRANRLPKLPTDMRDSESSEYDSHIKGCTESEPLSPESCVAEKFLQSPNKSLCKEKPVVMTGCSPISESSKGVEENDELQMYLQQNHDDGLASAVALFTVALDRVKTKLKSMTKIKSVEILRAASEEIFLQSRNVESQIKIDMDKLTSHSKSQRKRLETRFQEQQEQLLGIYKKFKEQVDQQLDDFGNVIEGLEEHEIKLKVTVEKQRETHKKLLSQLEQAIKVQLNDAESRITAIQELAGEKMLQLKLVIAECLKYGAFG
ncbi:hypothetical protein ACJIZ3_011294 [Penstemon smallii]|uniref:Meiosis-specific protein ASY3-like coiled-coil domain-containing protein n=1 Tax=Penstemon smallii TaxID=265156 RepID=A0ABD3UMA6_9LAMI